MQTIPLHDKDGLPTADVMLVNDGKVQDAKIESFAAHEIQSGDGFTDGLNVGVNAGFAGPESGESAQAQDETSKPAEEFHGEQPKPGSVAALLEQAAKPAEPEPVPTVAQARELFKTRKGLASVVTDKGILDRDGNLT